MASTSESVIGRQEHCLTVIRSKVTVHEKVPGLDSRRRLKWAENVQARDVKDVAFVAHFLRGFGCDAQHTKCANEK